MVAIGTLMWVLLSSIWPNAATAVAPSPVNKPVAVFGKETISDDELQFAIGNRLLASETQIY